MITDSTLQAYLGKEKLDDGYQQYENEPVTLWAEKSEGGITVLNGEMTDSRTLEEVHTQVMINDAGGWIVDSSCSCKNYQSNYMPCRHIAASLIAYRLDGFAFLEDEENEEEDTAPVVPVPAASDEKESSSLILRALGNLSGDSPSSDVAPGSLMILPILTEFDAQNSSVLAEFRVGDPHRQMYVMKNITAFVEAVKNNDRISYGKKLDFRHTRDAFDPKCLPLLDLLTEFSDENDTYKPGADETYYYYYSFRYDNSLKRELSLKGRYLDLFMDLLKDIPFKVREIRGYAPGEVTYQLLDESPDLAVEMKRSGEGYEMTFRSELSYCKGHAYVYFEDRKKKEIRRMPVHDRRLVPILDVLSESRGHAMYIASRDLPAFSREIFPVLSTNVLVRSDGFDPLDYIPSKPHYEIYLDLPQPDTVTCRLSAVYRDGTYNVLDRNHTAGKRDEKDEKEMDRFVTAWFTSFDPLKNELALSGDDDKMYALLSEGIPKMQEKAAVFVSDRLKRITIRSASKVSVGISVAHDLLQLDMTSEEMSMAEVAEILSRYDRKKKFYRLKNGEFITVDENTDLDRIAEMAEALQLSSKDIAKGTASLPKFRALYLDSAADAGFDIERDIGFRNLVRSMKNIDPDKYQIPEHLKDTMRGYQKDGFRWLCSLKDNGFGALLADEMGLGKTLQVLAFAEAMRNDGRVLIVCPASLVYNWASEIRKFTPSLNARMITGTAPVREYDILHSAENDVLITSYDLLKRDIDIYEQLHFEIEIIDEAQYIKNAGTMAARAVKRIDSSFRAALTGTPIENRLSELWSIFDYMMPGFFYGYKHFRDTFEQPIIRDKDEAAEAILQRMITPFILRRLKKDVLKDLPDKLEEVYYAPLEGEQKQLYHARVQRIKLMLEQKTDQEFTKGKIEILAELTRLRQICCNPALLYDNYRGSSAKEELCLDMIRRAIEEGHKILLFSQFTSMLDLLTKRLKKEDIAYHMLTGSTSKKDRADMVEAFQNDDVPVFCISLKAGGTGLNLTAADVVIHYDPWWNTAVEDQASDRAHRIGQTNIVTVYRLIIKDTIEERILSLQQEKSSLSERLLTGEGISSSSLTREDLLALL